MKGPGPTSRFLPCWLSGFLEWTDPLPAPPRFRKWAGLSCIQGALTRRIWHINDAGIVYPNQFSMLVGPPGSGKDKAIGAAKDLWKGMNTPTSNKIFVGPESISPKGLLDTLASERARFSYMYDYDKTGVPLNIDFQSFISCITELGTSVTEGHTQLLSFMNKLYDCGDEFEDKVRGGEMVRIENPHLHMLWGTQPDYLGMTFREEAFGMGFFSRMIMIYEEGISKKDPYKTEEERAAARARQADLRRRLIYDLRKMTEMVGEILLTKTALDKFRHWYMNVQPYDGPTHYKLRHYNSRRPLHMLKLMMAFSASRNNELLMTEQDFDDSLETLLEAEIYMPKVFSAMLSSRGNHSDMEEVIIQVGNYMASQKVAKVPEHVIVRFLLGRVPSYQILSVIDGLVAAKRLLVLGKVAGERLFKLPEVH